MAERGSTVLETLVVLAIMGIGLGVGTVYLGVDQDPLTVGIESVDAACRQARLHAIAAGTAYRLKPASADRIVGETSASCGDSTWTADDGGTTSLPDGVTLTSTGWSVCFSRRGMASENQEIRVQHSALGSTGIEVLIGGTTRSVP